MMMTIDEFFKKFTGKAIDYDKAHGVQCVDLIDEYLRDCYNITGVWVTGARDFYNHFNSWQSMRSTFERIPNTRELVVKRGDIVVWNGGKWGHVAIGTGEGTIDWFTSLEQNTRGRYEAAQIVKHYFANRTGADSCSPVLGVLRPRRIAEDELITVSYKIKRKYKAELDKVAAKMK